MFDLDPAAQDDFLDNNFGATRGPNAPASFLVHLSAGDPSIPADQGGGVEFDTGNGYAAVGLDNDASWPGSANGVTAAASVSFGPSTDAWTAGGVAALASHWFLTSLDGVRRGSGALDQEVDVSQPGVTIVVACRVAFAR